MKTTILPMIFALALISSTHAQTITNVGPGEAGTSVTYNISISDDGAWIIINGKWWLVGAMSAGSPYTKIMKWDDYNGKFAPFGQIKATTLDGKQFLGGMITIRTAKALPHFRLTSFKAISFAVPPPPQIMPTLTISSLIAVYVKSPITGTFVPRPDLNWVHPYVSGTIWLNSDYSLHSAVYDTARLTDMPIPQLTIVPPPGGLGGVIPPVMPARMK